MAALALAAGLSMLRLPPAAFLLGAACYGAYAALATRALRRSGLACFGIANAVTLARGALLSLVLPFFLVSGVSWWPAGLGLLALVLDGIDGWLARRRGIVSEFGTRFDMETDALTVLVLSILVLAEGRAGSWVLLSGAMRYLNGLAQMIWPVLARPLPPSLARKTICVLQILLLLAALAPAVPSITASWLAALGLGLLIWSFGRDLIGLMRTRPMADRPSQPYLSGRHGV